MAATVRKFQDLISGTITDNPLLVGGTTLNSAVLASLIVVADPDFIALTLDPERASGAPEIVWVTAHTASATSATILRGQEGSAAREHLSGTKVIAPVTADALEGLATDAELAAVDADLTAVDGRLVTAEGEIDALQAGGNLVKAGTNIVNTDIAAGVGDQAGAQVTFSKPAAWGSYTILVRASAAFGVDSNGPTNTGFTVKVDFAGAAAAQSIVVDSAPSGGESTFDPVGVFTGQTASGDARVLFGNKPADVIYTHLWSSISFVAFRTS